MDSRIIGMSFDEYRHLRAYCYQELKAYLNELGPLSGVRLASDLVVNHVEGVNQDCDAAYSITLQADITPPVLMAAKLLFLAATLRVFTVNGLLSTPITEKDAQGLWDLVRDAASNFASVRNLSPSEEKMLFQHIPPKEETSGGKPEKHLSKALQQEAAILDELKRLGHDPLKLPMWCSNKKGVKAEVRAILPKRRDLFTTKTFDTTWQRLRDEKKIKEIE